METKTMETIRAEYYKYRNRTLKAKKEKDRKASREATKKEE